MENYTKYKRGIYNNIPIEEYFELPYYSKTYIFEAYNKSGVHAIYKFNKDNRELRLMETNKSKALSFGSFIDALLLDQEEVLNRFVIEPETYTDSTGKVKKWDLRSSICRKIKEETDKIMIKKSDVDKASEIKKQLTIHHTANKIIMQSDKQVTIITRLNGLTIKTRPDMVLLKEKAIIDLKTTSDASPRAFKNSIYRFGYHIQASLYIDAYNNETHNIPIERFLFIAVEKDYPFGIAVYELDQSIIEDGRRAYREGIKKIVEALKDRDITPYPDQVVMLS